jgi:septal ring factor EnvC (AmiA/AmiB activator)
LTTNQNKARHQKKTLIQELKATEQNISKTTIEIEKANQTIAELQNDIIKLQQAQKPLQEKLDTLSQELGYSLLFSRQLGKADPIYLVANQKDPTLTKRLITYLSYIKQHQINLLAEAEQLQQSIQARQTTKQEKMKRLSTMQSEQTQKLTLFKEDNSLQKDIIQAITAQLKTDAQKIKQLKINQRQLQQILGNIEQKKLQKTDLQPFYRLKKHLPWPIRFKQKGRHTDGYSKGNGIFIPLSEGRQIYAVRAGKVAFSDWLRGYGLLIILQHDNGFMTLYANNQALYKEKGETVTTGEKIATSGHSGGQLDDGLYFEIRQHGQPLPPQTWLK